MDEIKEFRKKIDDIDQKLIDLLNKRSEIAFKIKKLKLVNNLPILDEEREKKIHKMIQSRNKGLIKKEDLEKIFTQLLEAMRSIDVT